MDTINKQEDELFAKFGVTEPAAAASPVSEDDLFAKFGVNERVASKPAYANGLTADTAVNISPLDANERLAIKGLGNRQVDIENSLKKRFQEVTKGKDGEFRVKNTDGLWYQVDPNTLEGRDAIDVTRGILRGVGSLGLGGAASVANMFANTFIPGSKFETNPLKLAESFAGSDVIARETVGEAAENLDTAAMLAAGTAVAPLAAGATAAGVATAAGTAALASGATKLGLTSLGRLEGTYDAPIEQQLQDSAYEAGLAALGTFIPAGVRFGLDKFAAKKAAAKATQVLANAPEEKLPIIRTFFKDVIDDVSFDRIATPGNKVQSFIDEGAKYGKDLTTFQDQMRLGMISSIKSAAQEATEGLSTVYTNQIDELMKAVPSNFKMSTEEVLRPVFDDFVMQGIATRENFTGKIILNSYDDLLAAESSRYLNGVGKDVAFDRATYGKLSELFERMQQMSKKGAISGPEALKEMLEDQRVLKNLTKKMQSAGKTDMGLVKNNVMYRTASRYGDAIKNALPDALPKPLGDKLRNINASYKSLKQQIEPLEAALRSDSEALKLATAMTGRTAAGTLDRALMPNVVQNFTKWGGPRGQFIAQKLMQTADDLADRKAAIQFTAPMRAQLSAFQAGAAAQSVAKAADQPGMTAVANLGWAASLLSRYPKAAKASVDARLKLSAMLRAGTGKMSPPERAKFLFDGDVLESMARTFNIGLIQAQTQEQLMSEVPANGQQDSR